MGQPAKAEIFIQFKEVLPTEFNDATTLKEALIADYRTKSGDTERVDMWIEPLEVLGRDSVTLTVYSERIQNCEWQLEQLIEYLKDKYPTDVACFDSTGFTYVDDMCHSFEADEWMEFIAED